jgi:hypothetical protein
MMDHIHEERRSERRIEVRTERPSELRTELRLGCADERGAALHGVPQTTHDGRVTQLQNDLARLGFEPGPADGLYGLGTARAVRALQDEASRCTCETGIATYEGPIDGVCNAATVVEIQRWVETLRSRHRVRLGPERGDDLVRTAAQALGRGRDPWSYLAQDGAGGALHGIGLFSQGRGDLGQLLQRLLFADTKAFSRIFGRAEGRRLVLELSSTNRRERIATPLAPLAVAFAAAAAEPAFRAEQVQLTRRLGLESVLEVARENGIVHERGLAMMWRASVRGGPDAAAAVARAIGPRPAGTDPARHLRDAQWRVGKRMDVEAPAAPSLPSLHEELRVLASCDGFDDCQELWWW